ncbi:hypothetical protein MMC07_003792 [Pseudocyphellaria aurata]|nr:hypothetical protein [Pseudocyphellaria aurata]
MALCGGERQTKDIDVLVDVPAKDIQDVLRPRVSEINGHFAQMGFRQKSGYHPPFSIHQFWEPAVFDLLCGKQGRELRHVKRIVSPFLPQKSFSWPKTCHKPPFTSSNPTTSRAPNHYRKVSLTHRLHHVATDAKANTFQATATTSDSSGIANKSATWLGDQAKTTSSRVR